jgi:hypothetical protein
VRRPTASPARGSQLAVGEWERRWHGLASARADNTSRRPPENGKAKDLETSPYVGLAAFERADADRFVGRAESTAELFARITEQRFVVVFGESGSGKSSLLRAGLAARWAGVSGPFVVMTPGDRPLAEYDAALTNMPDPACADLLVVVDQFEEVFTVCTDERCCRLLCRTPA